MKGTFGERTKFNFNVELFPIPTREIIKAETMTTKRVKQFFEETELDELLILYYGGHASGSIGSDEDFNLYR